MSTATLLNIKYDLLTEAFKLTPTDLNNLKKSKTFQQRLELFNGSYVGGEFVNAGGYYDPNYNQIWISKEYQGESLISALSHELGHATGKHQAQHFTQKEVDTKNATTYKTAQEYSTANMTGEGEAIFYEYKVAKELGLLPNFLSSYSQATTIQKHMNNTKLTDIEKIQKIGELNENMTPSGQPQLPNGAPASIWYTYDVDNKAWFLGKFTYINSDYKEIMGDDLIYFNARGEMDLHNPKAPLANLYRIISLTTKANNFFEEMKADTNQQHDILENNSTGGTQLAQSGKEYDLLYGGRGNDKLTGNSGKDILLGGEGNDTLHGNAGTDILGGNAGNDTLYGGAGADKLNGGKGKDTYHILDHDTIIDSDKSGAVYFEKGFNGKPIQAQSFIAISKDIWLSTNTQNKFYGEMLATRQGNHLSITTNSHSVVINDFFGANAKKDAKTLSWNGLDISLKDFAFVYPKITKPTSTQKNHTLFRFTHEYINKLSATATEAQHETARLAAATKNSGSETDDMLMSTQNGGSVVFLNGGNDLAYGGYGYDWLYGGLGNDMLIGSALAALNSRPDKYGLKGNEKSVPTHLLDRDYLVGGAGSDLIFGVDGNDVIFTDEDGFEKGKIAGHLQPENAKESHKRGDLAAGGKGDDMIYGSQMRDLLSGGAGSDTIFGGAGRDVLVGDGEFFPEIKRFYQVTANVINDKNQLSEDSSIFRVQHLDFTPSSAEFANPKHANNQNAWDFEINNTNHQFSYQSKVGTRLNEHAVKIGGASDYLFGGMGDDLLIGQFGNDYLDGGDGNDYLWGDDYLNKAISGNDTLKGGAGSNVLYGGKGDDSYIFTSADLKNKADKNIIRDEDGLGKIIIDGIALHSIAWKADPKNTNTHWTDAKTGLDLRLANGNLTVSSSKFAAKITIENFKNGVLGLKLLAAPSARMIYDDESFVYATQTNPQEIHLHENQII